MPNPNRPQYQDVIEETWGDAVADTVVRRFATTAARDADLAAFTPAQLKGQVIAIMGNPVELQVHDGTAWLPIGAGAGQVNNYAAGTPQRRLYVCAGEGAVMTNQFGTFTVTLPPGGRFVAGVSTGLNQYGASQVHMRDQATKAQGGNTVQFIVYNNASQPPAPWVNAYLTVAYVIIYTLDATWVPPAPPTELTDDEINDLIANRDRELLKQGGNDGE